MSTYPYSLLLGVMLTSISAVKGAHVRTKKGAREDVHRFMVHVMGRICALIEFLQMVGHDGEHMCSARKHACGAVSLLLGPWLKYSQSRSHAHSRHTKNMAA